MKNKVLRSTYIAALLWVCGTTAFAQSANTITIKYDDGDGITGELLEATDDAVRLDTLMGAVTIPLDGVTCIGTACPESIRLKIEDAPVVLTALDGSSQIAGNLLEIADDEYVLATDLGEFRIGTTLVTCEGDACPALQPEVAFGGPVTLTNGSASIEGVLVGLEDDAYLIETPNVGTLRVSNEFSCSGDGCPIE